MLDPTILKYDPRQPDSILVRQATKGGYIACPVGGVFDASYPNSKLRRGRVQGGGDISPTVTCSPELYVLLKEK